MFLIMSAAYVGQELESEFGKVPPSFLPLGNRRLFQHQVALAPAEVAVFISIPESYRVSDIDLHWLEEHGVTIIQTPDKLSLGASLVASLNLSEHNLDSPMHILFGDTLFSALPVGDDVLGISEVQDSYNWAVVTHDKTDWLEDSDNQLNANSNNVVNGYFKFSQPRQLIKFITQNDWQFLKGVNRYHQQLGLSTIKLNDWLDFGHVNTYYRSKASFTTQRAFNELTITAQWIEKSSIKDQKIRAEANWFTSLPPRLRGYTPQFLGEQQDEQGYRYRLEYLHHTALNELFVFAELPTIIWKKILHSCLDFIDACREYPAPDNVPVNDLDALFGEKTRQRLQIFCQERVIELHESWQFNGELNASLQDLLTLSGKHLPSEHHAMSVLHGDFCFSNILYDFRTGRIKTIDPRGLDVENQLTIYGDTCYDLAKLSHSVLGLYDWIIAGYFDVAITDKQIDFELTGARFHKDTQQIFIDLLASKFNITALNVYAMQIQLFLSMLPLHADDQERQNALFANAFRIYQILQRLEK